MTEVQFSEKLSRMIGMPASEFVLHRKPMLLLDQLVEIELESAACEWLVRTADVFLVRNLGIPAYVGIECMAQCIAVHAGAIERASGFPPPVGLLLGTRNYTSSIRYFSPDTTYRVECIQLLRNTDGMGSFDCSILSGGDVIVQARLTVLQKPRGDSRNG